MNNKINVLMVDDEEFNLDIMKEYFDERQFNCLTATNGKEALNLLELGHSIDVIVLDRMMPNMDGMQFLKVVKQSLRYRDIPVVMQTAATANHQIVEGINAGVFYYLSKPYSKEVFLSIVKAANDDAKRSLVLKKQMKDYGCAMGMIKNGEFKFRTLDEARSLAVLISSCLPNAEHKLIGLSELMINSIEHGNLGITYPEKTDLKLSERWEEEINHRLNLQENAQKYCYLYINYNENKKQYTIRVKDEGKGFEWNKFLEFDPKRFTDPNGRGIMVSRNSGFDKIIYHGNGNEFECIINL